MYIVKIIIIFVLLHINNNFYQRTIININSTKREISEKSNGDEQLYNSYHFGNFLKIFPKDSKGLIDKIIYQEYLSNLPKQFSYEFVRTLDRFIEYLFTVLHW